MPPNIGIFLGPGWREAGLDGPIVVQRALRSRNVCEIH
jgi:hypothetical protein